MQSRLVVREIQSATGEVLELLDCTADESKLWTADLPVRLCEHSHWLSRSQGALLFRPVLFNQRAVDFLITTIDNGKDRGAAAQTETQGAAAAPKCVRIPSYLRNRSWKELHAMAISGDQLHDYMVVLPHPSQALSVLSKFESPKFIHSYLNSSAKTLMIELPRFKLEFELREFAAEVLPEQPLVVYSLDFTGYRLSSCQQFSDTLFGFSRYLLLEKVDDPSDVKVVVPTGVVVAINRVDIVVPDAANADLSYSTYRIHKRFAEIRASSLESRLQLAALYAATSIQLPEPRTKMSGVEQAIDLIRRCYVDRPLSERENEQLGSVEVFRWKSPALYLLCAYLLKSSQQFEFLRALSSPSASSSISQSFQDCASEYFEYCSTPYPNFRLLLTVEEEKRLFGTERRRRVPFHAVSQQEPLLALHELPVPLSYPDEQEKLLAAMISKSKPLHRDIPPCPVHAPAATDGNALERYMMEELQTSWDIFHRLPVVSLWDSNNINMRFQSMHKEVSNKRAQLEQFLLDGIQCHPVESVDLPTSWHMAADRLLRLVCRVPQPSMVDLVRSKMTPQIVTGLNRFFLARNASMLDRGVMCWMQLCVLEDKLLRLCKLSQFIGSKANADLLLKELQVTHIWDVNLYPMWLAFEVDMGIQIRPEQFRIAEQLIQTPGAIVQLNMGEGKTRTILPMLMLHLTLHTKQQPLPIVRFHFLTDLLGEAYMFMHEHVTAGILNRKLFTMPFDRDVIVTAERIALLTSHAQYCQREGGALFVTPESRCSMRLKQLELNMSEENSLCRELAQFEDTLPFRDVFDESDELLKQKLQVIYAVGAQLALPALSERCVAMQSILRLLCDDAAIRKLLSDTRIAVCEPDTAPQSFFKTLRLLPGAPLDSSMPQLVKLIAAAILDNPPYELLWLRKFKHCDKMIRYVTDSSTSADEIIARNAFKFGRHCDALLALRGLLAYGLILSCLTQRHRVHYGINNDGQQRRKKKVNCMAVPFHSCDVPSERSEFAQPDVAILYTHLAYLYTGLQPEQVDEAVTTLLTLGSSQQAVLYAKWFKRSHPDLKGSQAFSIDSVNKIDLTNRTQRELLHSTFHKNIETIFFWMQYVMLPVRTKQFPHRIKASAWDVAAHPQLRMAAVGFSGTNDNHLLLPLQVHQQHQLDDSIRATNGRMLALLMEHSRYESELAQSQSGEPFWKRLLGKALHYGAVAIIDAGALLAGVSGSAAAEHVIHHLLLDVKHHLKGVVYFENNEWHVQNLHGRTWNFAASPIREDEAFVIFDERHCRGADMLLKQTAKAVLTLGPNMSKDKFMQAAGRLRQLGRGQSIVLVAQHDVHMDIISAHTGNISAIATSSVLRWVMANSICTLAMGMLEWAENGIHFLRTHAAADAALVPEKLRLDEFYLDVLRNDTIMNFVYQRMAHSCSPEWRSIAATQILSVLDHIEKQIAHYCSATHVVAAACDEECEREIELEIEQEKEVEKQLPKQFPAQELDWDYKSFLLRPEIKSLSSSGLILRLDKVIERLLGDGISAIHWGEDAKGQVYVTKNFFNSLDAKTATGTLLYLNDFLRPADAYLVLSDGHLLLLSDREANAFVPLLRQTTRQPHPVLQHLEYASTASLHLPNQSSAIAPNNLSIVRILLFNGQTKFDVKQRDLLLQLLPSTHAKQGALLLPVMRGFSHAIARSDLDEVCQ